MAYKLKYYFNFWADKDVRLPDQAPLYYYAEILEDGYLGSPTEIQAQDSPISINYTDVGDNPLMPLKGSEATLNLIATTDFQLDNLFTENETKYQLKIYQKPAPSTYTINWSNNDRPDGQAVEAFLQIYVNNVLQVQSFTTESGSFTINAGDNVSATVYSVSGWPTPQCGLELSFTAQETQRTPNNATPISLNNIVIDQDTTIAGYSTYSNSLYRAIRSAVFLTSCPYTIGSAVTYTKAYTGVDQATADANAAADTNFNSEGQANADLYGTCFPNSTLIWQGFVIPDGCMQSFTFTPYNISINCVEGLGLLKNLSFVQNSGNIFLGKLSFIEVIYNCLNRISGDALAINTCVNIYEESMPQGDAYDPLDMSYVNAARYFKEDGFTPMNCQEVLESVLEEWKACIIQSEGEWYIFRPSELALSGDLVFRRYVNGQRSYDTSTVTKDLNVLLGGESEGEVLAPLFHINRDQTTMIAKPYKNSSISYRYGFLASLVENPNFTGWDGSNFPGWTKSDVLLPLSESPLGGAVLGHLSPFDPFAYIYNTTPVDGTAGDIIVFNLAYYIGPISNTARARVYLTDGITDYWLAVDGSWVTSEFTLDGVSLIYYDGSLSIQSQPLPVTGDLTIQLLESLAPAGEITYRSADLVPAINPDDPIGELHTATQAGDYTHVPETINVFNGDDTTESHVGAIYRDDQVTLTTLWNRRDLPESVLATPYQASKQFLRIAVEETVRLHGAPYFRYEGSIFGYFNPLSRFTINLLTGAFMPLSLTYDLQANICKAALQRISNEEIAMAYLLTADFGDTTKVTIK